MVTGRTTQKLAGNPGILGFERRQSESLKRRKGNWICDQSRIRKLGSWCYGLFCWFPSAVATSVCGASIARAPLSFFLYNKVCTWDECRRRYCGLRWRAVRAGEIKNSTTKSTNDQANIYGRRRRTRLQRPRKKTFLLIMPSTPFLFSFFFLLSKNLLIVSSDENSIRAGVSCSDKFTLKISFCSGKLWRLLDFQDFQIAF